MAKKKDSRSFLGAVDPNREPVSMVRLLRSMVDASKSGDLVQDRLLSASTLKDSPLPSQTIPDNEED